MGKPTLIEQLRLQSGGNVLQLFGDHPIPSPFPLGRIEQQADRLPEFLTLQQLHEFFLYVCHELGQMGYPVQYIEGQPTNPELRGVTRHQIELKASEHPNDWIVLLAVNTIASESERAVNRIMLKRLIIEITQYLESTVSRTR